MAVTISATSVTAKLKGSKPIWMLMFENEKLIFLDLKVDVRGECVFGRTCDLHAPNAWHIYTMRCLPFGKNDAT
jgi:hypothetical protein